nr:hypothetical protein [Oceanirhabdus seepicola]
MGDKNEIRHDNHSVFLLQYHLILVVKYRREVIKKYIQNQGKR